MTDSLTEQFEHNRAHLRAVAYRILGSATEADDAVQEAWLRLNRSDPNEIANLGGWLTTVVARVCLDLLRSRRARREEPIDDDTPEELVPENTGPDRDVHLADSLSSALVLVLELLTPAERVAFVLHDMFDLSFEEIAPIVGRSTSATRQLASRGRRRVRGASVERQPDRGRQREIVDAFLTASRGGDFAQLVALLHPHVVLHADPHAVRAASARQDRGAPNLAPEIRGADDVAATLFGRARGAQPALIDGLAGAAWAPGGQPRALFRFTVADDRVVAIDIVSDPTRLREFDVVLLSS
jgi:RNA polymerase sigma-70 factor (ECF subfamily)